VEQLPRTVDRYELLSVLGSGGFATVYRARHVHTQQLVAVKLLTHAAGADRALAEARAAAAVQHPNVVRVLDCGVAGDDVFIVMELAEGPTLADVMAQTGTLSPQRAVGIATQLLDGLAAAHACGIVHRDVKPPNVLLAKAADGSDLPKILDFGVSKRLTEISSTLDGTAIGTPGYMAPELFGGAKHADARADVYAVATTLYEMLSGKLPFGATTYEELVVQVATQSPAPLLTIAPFVPPAIAAAVDRGLARDRDARWQTVEQFKGALRGALDGIMPAASHAFLPTLNAGSDPSNVSMRTAPPPAINTSRRTEMHSALSWAIGVVGVVSIVGVGAAFMAWRALHTSRAPDTATLTAPPRHVDAPLVASEAPTAPNAPTAQPGSTVIPAVIAATAPASVGGVKFKFPAQVVGQARATAIDALAQRIAPQVQRCRPEHGRPPVVARVRLFVQAEGTISIAQAASEPGDQDAAECIAALFKEAANPQTFSPGGGGIVTVEAKLDPR